ncbi:hypothetical protein [Acidisphaera sp. L21]|uniref:hypothetical protein n=1 Tax=Acidisphaera sp. L21 TaxID=1641851 RepID=UPI00131C5487|nr:hypothetical protein [Acidisphaera sp. L21]
MLLGQAAVAMWWDIAPTLRSEFQNWHSHEHFPERMGIPGFLRGSRWTDRDGATGVFVMYELDSHATVASAAYLDRLNHPTPWSTKMMPHHLNMVRSLCRVAASHGGGIAAFIATIRFSPAAGRGDTVRRYLDRRLPELAHLPGLCGAHLLVTDMPGNISQTAEQGIRGGDGIADWVLVISGYDEDALCDAIDAEVTDSGLLGAGVAVAPIIGRYRLSLAMSAADLV